MAIRDIIQIDERLCDGCGQCVPSCVEGALRVINGKARLVSDVLCDGLGACLGHCPTGALTVVRRAAEGFDQAAVSKHAGVRQPVMMASNGPAGMTAHAHAGGCPGTRVQSFDDGPATRPGNDNGPRMRPTSGARHPANLGYIGLTPQLPPRFTDNAVPSDEAANAPSKLRQWPVQLHLVPPTAPFFRDRDVLLAADCVPVAVADFHRSFLEGRSLAIACPKLDQHLEAYVEKLAAMIDEGGIRSLTVAIMEVPCCGGLLRLAQAALDGAQRQVPLTVQRVSIRGEMM